MRLDTFMESTNTVAAIVSDLMFTVRIQDAANHAGVGVMFLNSAEDALQRAKEGVGLIIIDLNGSSFDPLETVARLKSDDETSGVEVVGYVSHVQTELIQAARKAGCDTVMARSAFVQKLPEMLARLTESSSNPAD